MELCGPQVHSLALGCQRILCMHEVHELPPPNLPCTTCRGDQASCHGWAGPGHLKPLLRVVR